jgi:2-phospho-L-lactate guanylyltransferase
VWAVVPAKSLGRGKSRLRAVLDDEDRTAFARTLLEHVLGVLGQCGLDGVLVATDGDDVAELAASMGARVRRDRDPRSLAHVVDGALAEVEGLGARTAVVLMADLPRIEPADVHALLSALDDHEVAVVRDHKGRHTNALAVSPPTAMATCFGSSDSFAAHCESARRQGLRLAVVQNERFAFDVDAPADLARVTTPRPGGGT